MPRFGAEDRSVREVFSIQASVTFKNKCVSGPPKCQVPSGEYVNVVGDVHGVLGRRVGFRMQVGEMADEEGMDAMINLASTTLIIYIYCIGCRELNVRTKA